MIVRCCDTVSSLSFYLSVIHTRMNIPRYHISFTHEMTVPADSDTGRHDALFLGPILNNMIYDYVYICANNYFSIKNISRSYCTNKILQCFCRTV